MKINNTFYIWLMRSIAKNFLFQQHSFVVQLIVINNEEKYKINNILNSRRFKEKIQYKTLSMNYSFDCKWYDVENFKKAQKIMNEFHRKYSKKLRFYSIN